MVIDDTDRSLRLDAKRFPVRLEVNLPEEVIERIQAVADASGRSFSEAAIHILSSYVSNP